MTKAKVILLAAAATLRWQAPLPPWTRKGEDVAKKFIRLAYLPVVVSLCGLSPLAAEAQFTQQGPKLVGTGAIGPDPADQGYSVSISANGNTAIVGGPEDNDPYRDRRRVRRCVGVYPLNFRGVEPASKTRWRRDSWRRIAFSVAISANGNTAIVGGREDNEVAGAAWVFTRSASGVWTQQGDKLVGTGADHPAAQGTSVSLSADGNTAIVGGPFDFNGLPPGGAAWVFTRSASGLWTQQGDKLVGTGAIGPGPAHQGDSVALSGDGNTAIVGGPDDNGFAGTGAAWVFTRSASGIWTQQAKLVGAGVVGPYAAQQGRSVALSGDGNTAIVGAPFDNGMAGAAWVFTRSASGIWTQQGDKLVGTGVVGPFAEQGFSVSLSADGNIAIVGGPADNGGAGAAWVFTRSGEVWTQLDAKLVGTGAIGPDPAGQGHSVSISANGSTAIIGGPGDNNSAGAAWVFAPPVFAGTPGQPNCFGQSVAALTRQYGGLNAAAAALGYPSVSALQQAIMTYCEA